MRRTLAVVAGLFLAGCASGGAQSPATAPTQSAAPPAAASAPAIARAEVAPENRPGIAVFPFYNGGSIGATREDLDALQIGLQQMMLTELAQNPSLRVVERSTIRELIEEQNLAATGRVDARTAAQVGKIVGARYVVTGVFMDISGDFRMDGRVVDVETSEVLRAQEVRGRREKIYDLLVDLSARITAGVDLPPLAADVQSGRRARPIPDEAVVLYSRALMLQDNGQTERAIELYRQINQRFPQMTEAREALRQLSDS
jgi:TolB-like protein